MAALKSLILILMMAVVAASQSKDWEPVPQNELQMAKPQVEADADAEVLFWEVRIADENINRAGWQSVINHHVRIKIFTERGRELNSKIDITYGNLASYSARVVVKDIFARTIKPDGKIIELKPEDIFERDVVRGNGIKVRAKSFAVPGIETGVIIEYKWKEIREDIYNYSRLELAREIPVQYVKYYIRPASNTPLGMRLHSINTTSGFEDEGNRIYSTTMRNVPAVKDEPRMPSEYEVKPWVLVWYDDNRVDQSAADYWKERGRATYDFYKSQLKVNGDIKTAAAKAIGDASEPLEKIRRIRAFCLASIKDIGDDALGLTPDQLKAIKPNNSPPDALKRGTGTWHDVAMVFGSMLISAGFDVRIAGTTIKNDAAFDRNIANDYFIRTVVVAVRMESGWQYFDLSNRYLPFGMVSWPIEGQTALIYDREPTWDTIPVSTPEQSVRRRNANLSLAPDGTLEGDVEIEFTGHLADFYREYADDDSPAERENYLKELIKGQIGNQAEITGVVIENLFESEKPFRYRFHLRVPAYAERTGKRLFFRPEVFARNTSALFVSGSRRYDIIFQYPWSETDEVAIELPPGFAPESVDAPPGVSDVKRGVSYTAEISLSDDRKTLRFKRNATIGTNGALSFPRSSYNVLKGLFESIQASDSQSVVLREN